MQVSEALKKKKHRENYSIPLPTKHSNAWNVWCLDVMMPWCRSVLMTVTFKLVRQVFLLEWLKPHYLLNSLTLMPKDCVLRVTEVKLSTELRYSPVLLAPMMMLPALSFLAQTILSSSTLRKWYMTPSTWIPLTCDQQYHKLLTMLGEGPFHSV